jgi:hypothetical protein
MNPAGKFPEHRKIGKHPQKIIYISVKASSKINRQLKPAASSSFFSLLIYEVNT